MNGIGSSTCSKDSFMPLICDASLPVILFVEDLQWSDEAFLDLLSTLMTDKDLNILCFVGAFRSNEVDDKTPTCVETKEHC
jgi:predicted ATPase